MRSRERGAPRVSRVRWCAEGESELNEREVGERERKGEEDAKTAKDSRGKEKGWTLGRRRNAEGGRARKKERERSGSPALLALRRLKARESARPRTRPGRDLLPSSFLHPALSLPLRRRFLPSLHMASHRSLTASPFSYHAQISLCVCCSSRTDNCVMTKTLLLRRSTDTVNHLPQNCDQSWARELRVLGRMQFFQTLG